METKRQYIRLATRYLALEDLCSYDYRHVQTARHLNLGEGLYTLTTSNLKWPDSVSYAEMKQARTDVITGMRNV